MSLALAEKWDNVGLLLEAPGVRNNSHRILLTIDLTTAVAEEALKSQTALIVSYHPTIFKPLSSITLSNPLQASILRCAAANISIYSPHTALDSVSGGINDWLGNGISRAHDSSSGDVGEITFLLGELEGGIGGQGRLVTLPEPVSMKEVERRIKEHLGLEHIQVGYRPGESKGAPSIHTIAICAGSGGGMLLGTPADVYFTGEMSHHEVLAAVATGHNVVLCGHTNTERGYLPILAEKLTSELQTEAEDVANSDTALASTLRSLEVHVSKEDKHPLQIV
ncbi:GTP cyclohydrolase I type 2/NIF3 family protein [Abortiporus biennis]